MIQKQLLETHIQPAVQDDGEDIEYWGLDLGVKLRIHGARSGCPSSSVALKSGIENMPMHYVREVKAVEHYAEDDKAALTGQME